MPVVLKMMVMYLQSKEHFLSEEGIFRKAVAIDEQQEAVRQIFGGRNYNYIQTIENPHLVAGICWQK